MMSNGTVQISLLEKEKVKINRIANRLKACLHRGGGPQLGEVTCGGSPHLTCKRDQIKMRDYMDKWLISPTWVPHLHVKRPYALCYLFEKSNVSSHQLNSETFGPVLLLKTIWYIVFRPFSCHLLLRVARMDMDQNLTSWANLSQVFVLFLQNSPKNYHG